MKHKKLVITLIIVIGLVLVATPVLAATGFYGQRANCDGTGKFLEGSNHELIADTLGLSSDELCELRSSGKSIAQIAADKGVDITELVSTIGQGKNGKQFRGLENGQGQGMGQGNGFGKGFGNGKCLYNQIGN
jgi:hypothetical protein